ncbi:hypothetical protein EYF80_049137 [Liparis tanakae]|uniref:Uncharacterized protein n=1 Tax=Liparis tanakae TaxID=230148 RepID=A0A4Z2FHJ9_9TELE|nr:hypothetical protein EYF80_049137 [Liparis tanakae]
MTGPPHSDPLREDRVPPSPNLEQSELSPAGPTADAKPASHTLNQPASRPQSLGAVGRGRGLEDRRRERLTLNCSLMKNLSSSRTVHFVLRPKCFI